MLVVYDDHAAPYSHYKSDNLVQVGLFLSPYTWFIRGLNLLNAQAMPTPIPTLRDTFRGLLYNYLFFTIFSDRIYFTIERFNQHAVKWLMFKIYTYLRLI